MSPDDPRHGTRRGYYAHRRADQQACDDCRRAAAGAQARYDYQRSQGIKNRLAPHGVQRRLQALVALGYTWERLDDELGEISRQSEKWALGRMAYVFPSTHAKVVEVYERLSMTLPPTSTPAERGAATRSRNRARRNGWLPPLAWTNIDDPDESPTDWQYRPPTREELLLDLDQQGAGISVACEALDVSRDSLQVWCGRKGYSDVYRRMTAREATPGRVNQHTTERAGYAA